ncbi:MAG: RNA polymerase subunit sigma-70 [Flavobacteriales bacterium]|nr:MAG: RNA polymerase subunit sigma-70 [Flavobacteriales bacterium]PIE48798.1 MAG: RNA polymerase subunit sigma-70 [Flavobacteriales bacterium]
MSQTKFIHQQLIKKCKRNNRRAQLQVYDLYVEAMYKTAYSFTCDMAVAEDLTQEAFLKAFTKIEQYKSTVTFGAWLKRIVINTCLDWLKKRKLHTEILDENTKEALIAEEDWEVDNPISAEQIYTAIEKLPANYKTIAKLYLLEGYDHGEIADILNISEVSSRSQLCRAKDKLRKMLNSYNYV